MNRKFFPGFVWLLVLPIPTCAWQQQVESAVEQKWVNPPASQVPGVEHRTFRSSSMNRNVGFNIYMPREYSAGAGNYPVIYWLHGLGGNESSHIHLSQRLDQAIQDKRVPPAIMVFVNGGQGTMYSDSVDRTVMAETAFIRELIPFVDKNYRTIPTSAGRAIQGMSMGGFGALKLAFKFPELFSSVLSYGGALHDADTLSSRREQIFRRMFNGDREAFRLHSPYEWARINADKVRGKLPIRMLIGSVDITLEYDEKTHRLLVELEIPHEYEILEGVRHQLNAYYGKVGIKGFEFAAKHFR